MARERNSEQAWATGGLLFAAITLIMLGIWQVFVGIAAIANDEFFVVGPNYTYDIDTTAWGWIHLVLGALAVFAGFFLFTGATWARAVGILFATLSAINNFIFLPYNALWALTVIALDVFVIWALATVDVSRTEEVASEAMGGYYAGERAQSSADRWPTNRPSTAPTSEPANTPTTPEAVPEPTNRPPLGRQ